MSRPRKAKAEVSEKVEKVEKEVKSTKDTKSVKSIKKQVIIYYQRCLTCGANAGYLARLRGTEGDAEYITIDTNVSHYIKKSDKEQAQKDLEHQIDILKSLNVSLATIEPVVEIKDGDRTDVKLLSRYL